VRGLYKNRKPFCDRNDSVTAPTTGLCEETTPTGQADVSNLTWSRRLSRSTTVCTVAPLCPIRRSLRGSRSIGSSLCGLRLQGCPISSRFLPISSIVCGILTSARRGSTFRIASPTSAQHCIIPQGCATAAEATSILI
jgi:hypothetical protein